MEQGEYILRMSLVEGVMLRTAVDERIKKLIELTNVAQGARFELRHELDAMRAMRQAM